MNTTSLIAWVAQSKLSANSLSASDRAFPVPRFTFNTTGRCVEVRLSNLLSLFLALCLRASYHASSFLSPTSKMSACRPSRNLRRHHVHILFESLSNASRPNPPRTSCFFLTILGLQRSRVWSHPGHEIRPTKGVDDFPLQALP